ncbi:MAG: hypothetical protein P8X89_24300 [Reinekea sp.]
MNFKDIAISRENRFSIGIEETSGKYYLSIPVSNQYVDYEEYYEISKEVFDSFKADMNSALNFVQQCIERKKDELLIQKPGRLRGVPM